MYALHGFTFSFKNSADCLGVGASNKKGRLPNSLILFFLLAAGFEFAEDVFDELHGFLSQGKFALIDLHEGVQNGNLKK